MYMALTMFAYKTLIAIQGMGQSCHIAILKIYKQDNNNI